jgi:hypothetical protein
MELFAFAFGGIAVAFGAMALGVLLGRPPLERGCGRVGPGGDACHLCTRPCPHRRAARARDASGSAPEGDAP